MDKNKMVELIGMKVLEIIEKQSRDSNIEIEKYLFDHSEYIELKIFGPEIAGDEVAAQHATPLEMEELQKDVFNFVMKALAEKNKPTLLS